MAPMLLISASFGSLFGSAANHLFPSIGVSEGAFALVVMAAMFGAATRAPFASIIFVFELTGDYKSILPLMVATVMADLVAETFLEDSIMTEKLSRRGLRVHSQLEVDALRTVPVRDVMTPAEPVLHEGGVSVAANDAAIAALECMLEEGLDALPVVDGEMLVGMCTPATIIRARAERFAHERVQPGWLTRALKRSI